MRALTLHQPWASFIVSGLKRWETRPRRTKIRGTIAIHASKHPGVWIESVYALLESPPVVEACQAFGLPTRLEHYPMGGIVGCVDIVDCVSAPLAVHRLAGIEAMLGDFRAHRFAWVLRNPVQQPEMIPCRGHQGFWTWDPIREAGGGL